MYRHPKNHHKRIRPKNLRFPSSWSFNSCASMVTIFFFVTFSEFVVSHQLQFRIFIRWPIRAAGRGPPLGQPSKFSAWRGFTQLFCLLSHDFARCCSLRTDCDFCSVFPTKRYLYYFVHGWYKSTPMLTMLRPVQKVQRKTKSQAYPWLASVTESGWFHIATFFTDCPCEFLIKTYFQVSQWVRLLVRCKVHRLLLTDTLLYACGKFVQYLWKLGIK